MISIRQLSMIEHINPFEVVNIPAGEEDVASRLNLSCGVNLDDARFNLIPVQLCLVPKRLLLTSNTF